MNKLSDMKDYQKLLDDIVRYGNMSELPMEDTAVVNRLCRWQIAMLNVPVTFCSELGGDFSIQTNKKALTEVISMLLSHAVSRMADMEDAEREPRVILSVKQKGEAGHLTISVTDEGLPFTTTQIRAELYLCRLIARLMGGDLRLDSDYKDGTRIIFHIVCRASFPTKTHYK